MFVSLFFSCRYCRTIRLHTPSESLLRCICRISRHGLRLVCNMCSRAVSDVPSPACGLLTVGSGFLCYRTGCRKKSSLHNCSTFSFSAAVLLLFFLFVRNHLVTACTKCSIHLRICHPVYRSLFYPHRHHSSPERKNDEQFH